VTTKRHHHTQLSSLQRSMDRKVLAKDEEKTKDEEKSRWRTWLTHPISALLLGGLVGITTTLIGTTISKNYDLRQYWREQRLTAYSTFLSDLQVAEETESRAMEAVNEYEQTSKVQPIENLDSLIAGAAAADAELDDSYSRVYVLGADDVLAKGRDAYYYHQIIFEHLQIALEDIRRREVLNHQNLDKLKAAYNNPDGTVKFVDFVYAARHELGVRI
jgi:hypothetical protein